MDQLRFVLSSLAGQGLRTALSALGVAIGVAAVVLLTSLGEGTRDYVAAEFSQFGTSLIAVNPGKTETLGTNTGSPHAIASRTALGKPSATRVGKTKTWHDWRTRITSS